MCTPLMFDVVVAETEADLRDACQVRALAYGHHLGDAVAGFASVEPLDRAPGTVVLLCRDKSSGQPIGTARIQVGGVAGCAQPLLIERCLILPHQISSRARAEITRLAVMPGADPLVKLCLMKAVYQYCEAHGIDWLVICARNEALSRNYRRLGFEDFLAPGEMMPLPHAGHIPHFIFTMDLPAVRQAWHRQGHRLHAFMFETMHPGWPSFRPAPVPALVAEVAPPQYQVA